RPDHHDIITLGHLSIEQQPTPMFNAFLASPRRRLKAPSPAPCTPDRRFAFDQLLHPQHRAGCASPAAFPPHCPIAALRTAARPSSFGCFYSRSAAMPLSAPIPRPASGTTAMAATILCDYGNFIGNNTPPT
ncbi:MAG TPA: hypothetical protein VGF34_16915, partial [Stellaceae bacterium]